MLGRHVPPPSVVTMTTLTALAPLLNPTATQSSGPPHETAFNPPVSGGR